MIAVTIAITLIIITIALIVKNDNDGTCNKNIND